MSEYRDGMRTGRHRKDSKRRRVCGQHYFFNTNARFNRTREYRANDQGGDACRDYQAMGSIIQRDFFADFIQSHARLKLSAFISRSKS